MPQHQSGGPTGTSEVHLLTFPTCSSLPVPVSGCHPLSSGHPKQSPAGTLGSSLPPHPLSRELSCLFLPFPSSSQRSLQVFCLFSRLLLGHHLQAQKSCYPLAYSTFLALHHLKWSPNSTTSSMPQVTPKF